jgi:GNAT superfamily N-acetyltransferase
VQILESGESWKIDEIGMPHQASEFSSLLDLCFPVQEGHRFLDDFPVWDPAWSCTGVKRFGMFREGRLASCAGVRIAELKGDLGDFLKIGLIGAVATHPLYRGSGFATRVVEKSVEWATLQGASLLMLWGSEYEFYQRLGFALSGEQMRIPLAALSQAGLFGKVKIRIQRGWHPFIFDLLKIRPEGLRLTEEDRAWMEAHKNVTWYYAESGGIPRAYVAYGRGIDLNGIYRTNPSAELLGSKSQFEKLGVPLGDGQTEGLCLVKTLKSSLSLPSSFWIWGLDAS